MRSDQTKQVVDRPYAAFAVIIAALGSAAVPAGAAVELQSRFSKVEASAHDIFFGGGIDSDARETSSLEGLFDERVEAQVFGSIYIYAEASQLSQLSFEQDLQAFPGEFFTGATVSGRVAAHGEFGFDQNGTPFGSDARGTSRFELSFEVGAEGAPFAMDLSVTQNPDTDRGGAPEPATASFTLEQTAGSGFETIDFDTETDRSESRFLPAGEYQLAFDAAAFSGVGDPSGIEYALSFSVVPEPAGLGLLAASGLLLTRRRGGGAPPPVA
jgi:hypothetical protein